MGRGKGDKNRSTVDLRWDVFDGFERPSLRCGSWSAVDAFVEEGRAYAGQRTGAFSTLLATWNQLLAEFGGDPSASDWSHFRPLGTDREEDWSDWLQHFLATSANGRLASELFGRAGGRERASFASPAVIREEVTDGRRADLVITWNDNSKAHVEVKVGDHAFEKTQETATKLESKHQTSSWSHFVLLPAEDVVHWNAIDHPAAPIVHAVTWSEVAVALRRVLRHRDESLVWRVWAHGFCGLVEQKLLGHLNAADAVASLAKMNRRIRQISIMQRGLDDV